MKRVEFETTIKAWLMVQCAGQSPRDATLEDVNKWLASARVAGEAQGACVSAAEEMHLHELEQRAERAEAERDELSRSLASVMDWMEHIEGETLLDKCKTASALWVQLADSRCTQSRLHRRTQQAERVMAKALHAQEVAEHALARHRSRTDGLEAELGPDWVRRLVEQLDQARADCERLRLRVREMSNAMRSIRSVISKDLCELVTVTCGVDTPHVQVHMAHFFGLTGLGGTQGEAEVEATRVRDRIHDVVAGAIPMTGHNKFEVQSRTPTDEEIKRFAVAHAMQRLLAAFEIEYVATSDPVEFARYTLARRMDKT